MSPKPTLVFVHGGWHDPSCLDLVRAPLESLGYNCHVPALPSIGKLAATKTHVDDVKTVHDIIQQCLTDGEDVIVVGHSNGGFKANGALEGLVGDGVDHSKFKGKVLGLALIAAFIPPAVGKGAFKDVPPMDTSWWIFNETEPTFLPNDPTHLFYHDLPPDQAAYWTSRIQPMNVPKPPLVFFEAWRHVPISYLFCTEDRGMPPAAQEAMIKAAKTEGGVVYVTDIKSSHSPFLSMPDQVVEWIEKAAKEELRP